MNDAVQHRDTGNDSWIEPVTFCAELSVLTKKLHKLRVRVIQSRVRVGVEVPPR